MIRYLAILNVQIKELAKHRAATFAGVCAQIFWGILLVMIYHAFYAGSATAEPLSLSQTLTFVWIGQALIELTPWNLDRCIETQVRNGDVAYELIRPLHLYGLWFTKSFAFRVIPTLLRFAPVLLTGWLWFGLSAPHSTAAVFSFCIALLLATFLSAAITTLILISLFWTLCGEGIQRLLAHVTLLFSGMIVPLPLFPSWMQPFLDIQPFRGIIDIPCRLYTGVIPPSEAPYYLGLQLAWIILFIFLGLKLMKRALRQFIIQGG